MVYESGNTTIDDAVDRVLAGGQLDRTAAIALLAQPVDELAAAADTVRATLGDGTVDTLDDGTRLLGDHVLFDG